MEIFAVVQSGTVTAEDIDAIIAKGVRDTEQLNKKLQEFSKDAMKFTMVRIAKPCLRTSGTLNPISVDVCHVMHLGVPSRLPSAT